MNGEGGGRGRAKRKRFRPTVLNRPNEVAYIFAPQLIFFPIEKKCMGKCSILVITLVINDFFKIYNNDKQL